LLPEQRVLDVGCGLGGTLAALAKLVPGIELVGLNIDRRQLELCRGIGPLRRGSLSLVEADACAIPFAASIFDHVFCIEAIFHFKSRQVFLVEAARLLRPGGSLLLSDIVLQFPAAGAPWNREAMAAVIGRDYGPWPDPWTAIGSLQGWAAAEGLDLESRADWTAQTLPSYRIVAPDDALEGRPHPDAGQVLRWLHTNGWLTYEVLKFRRRS
jgi:SAM-dependent methyltransferase